jgi:hypothetical protein
LRVCMHLFFSQVSMILLSQRFSIDVSINNHGPRNWLALFATYK